MSGPIERVVIDFCLENAEGIIRDWEHSSYTLDHIVTEWIRREVRFQVDMYDGTLSGSLVRAALEGLDMDEVMIKLWDIWLMEWGNHDKG